MSAPAMTLPKSELDVIPDSMRYEYDPWLLDDHPLRSHPTVCIPGLGTFLAEWYTTTQRRWKEGLLRTGCIVLACFVTFQCLRALPSTGGKGAPRPASVSHHSTRDWQFTCTFPHSDPRPNALAQSVAAGCDGLRTDIWLHGNELQMGPSDAGPKAINDMQNRLDSLFAKVGPRQAQSPTDFQVPLNADVSDDITHEVQNEDENRDDEDSRRSFWLVLDKQSSLRELYPSLVSHLDALRQQGQLTHWNGERIVQRPFTVIVTSESLPRSDCSNPYTDIFWSSTEELFSSDDATSSHLVPFCAV
ncbi:hypothetical protein N7532_000755 [Penicillium argentinense]|uniref:Uncharacterized protein n=1 Tax=Penicillium argentinense TaxID=1131581 RepID=A0A9W9KNM0_9EURO|nr:uncharacterized protein N7532_000755 [Penicillium argentinense]KAJ5112710.1 hypothetical protein N7532_000755 [Penicillium argentinense]